MTEKSSVFALGRFDWNFFGTFTFVRDDVPSVICRKYWFGLLRQLSGNTGIHFHRLVWMLRTEHGEMTGRFHYHGLIGGLPPHAVTELTCFALMAQWEHQRPLVRRKAPNGEIRLLSEVCGMARVRVFNPSMDGLDYFMKPDGGLIEGRVINAGASGRDQYEARKFGGADTVEWSHSLHRAVDASMRYGELVNRRRNTDSAVIIQRRQRPVGASYYLAGSEVQDSPALLVPGGDPGSTVNHCVGIDQFSTAAGIEPVLTGDRKSAWRDKGTGIFELTEA